MSQIFPPTPVPAGGRAEMGGGRTTAGLGDRGEQATFCLRVVLTFLGGGRIAAGLGDGRNITFVGTQFSPR